MHRSKTTLYTMFCNFFRDLNIPLTELLNYNARIYTQLHDSCYSFVNVGHKLIIPGGVI